MKRKRYLADGAGLFAWRFAHVKPGFSIEEALNALRPLMKVRSGKANVRFACSDSTGSKLGRTNYDTAGTGEASYMRGHQKEREYRVLARQGTASSHGGELF